MDRVNEEAEMPTDGSRNRTVRHTAAVLLVGALLPAAVPSAAGAAAFTPELQCEGTHSVALSPALTDSPVDLQFKDEFIEGFTVDSLDSPDCIGPGAASITDGVFTGGVIKVDGSKPDATCTDSTANATWTGSVTWTNGKTSTLSGGVEGIAVDEHGDATAEATAQITAGEFDGEQFRVLMQDETGAPGTCESSGVSALSGEDTVEIAPSFPA
jgi:hypothetical protein